jgi:hypothetical protein
VSEVAGHTGRPLAVPLTVAAFTAFALLQGFLLGADAWQYAVALLGLLACPLVLYVGSREIVETNGRVMMASWALMMIHPAMAQHGIPVGFLFEAALWFFSLAAGRQAYAIAKCDPSLRFVLAMFVVFMLVGMLSTVLGHRSKLMAAGWQILYNMKVPLMFLAGMLLVWTDKSKKAFALIVKWSWVFLLFFVLLEIALPGVHSSIFGPRPDSHGNPILHFGLRYRGPTQHPGVLAILCALLSSCAAIQWLSEGRRLYWLMIAGIYGVLALLTGERQETAALGLAVLVTAAVSLRRYWRIAVCVGVLMGAAVVAWLCLRTHPFRLSVLDDWGFGDPLAVLSERGVLYKGGFDIARKYFPWGSGFGTYGGVGAQKFDVSLSIDLGLERYWWFRLRMFLVDTYWPGVFAETGIFGFLSLVGFFGGILLTMIRRAVSTEGTPTHAPVLYALAAITLMLANSPSSILLTDPRGSSIFWFLIGAAWRASAPKSTLPKPVNTWQLNKGGR